MLRAESVIAVSAKADPQMNVRLSPEDVAQLKRVGAIEPAVRGLGAAMRRLIHASMQPGGSVPVEATADVVADDDSRREARIPAGVDDARALRDAVLQTRDDLRASVAVSRVRREPRVICSTRSPARATALLATESRRDSMSTRSPC